ncbi:MAG: PAS domain S-box protein [Leptolyngbya sp. SIO1E4]|nr:PAS domain S-box protein [Leptolyngbya sp. SIO1E4]
MFPHATAHIPAALKSAVIRNPLVVSPETTLMDAIAQMSGVRLLCNTARTSDEQLNELYLEARSSCVVVVEDSQVIGILTERDVVRLSAEQHPLDRLLIQQIIGHPVITLRESDFTDVWVAVHLLQQHRIRHLPILDNQDRLVGLVTHESLRQSSRLIDLLRLRLVKDVMTREVICASPACSILEIAQQMADHCISSVVIVEPGGSPTEPLKMPIGILTERDLVQLQALGLCLESCTAAEVMSTPAFVVKSQDSLSTVQQMMAQRLVRRLIVTGDQGELLGIVTQTNVLKALNPLELYKLAEVLEDKVVRLEAEKVALLQNRTSELEHQVEARTVALQTKVNREKLFAQIANRIRNSLQFEEILDTCVSEVRSLLQCNRVLVYQFQPDWSGFIIAESVEDGYSSALGNHIQDVCFQQQTTSLYDSDHPIVINNVDTAGYADCHVRLLKQYQVKANLVVPIRLAGDLWGLLIGHQCTNYREWQTEDITLLQDISVQLAIALKQATTYQQLQIELSERQQAEILLRESQQRYATLAAAAPVGIFRMDTLGNCIYVNERWCQLADLTPEAATGEGWRARVHPDDRDRIADVWDHAVQQNLPFQLEYRFQRLDGSITWVYGQTVAEQDANGQVIGYVGTITDISDRKQAELALKQSEAKSRAILAAIPDLMFSFGSDGTYRSYIVSNSKIDIFPTDHQPLGKLMTDVLPTEVAQRHAQAAQKAIATGELQIYEQTVRIGDHWQDEEVRVIKSSEDEVFFMIRDISDRKQAERQLQQLNQALETKVQARTAELQEREQFLQTLLDALPLSIFWKDRNSIYLGCNRNFLQDAGLTSMAGIIGKTDYDMPWSKTEADAYRADDQKVIAFDTANLGIIETQIQADGNQTWLETNKLPLHSLTGEVIGVLGTYQDITHRKQAEQAMKRQLAAMEAAIDGIAILQGDTYLYVNQAHLNLFGYESSEELIGQCWKFLYAPDELERFEREVWPVLERDLAWEGEAIATRKDGSTFTEGLSLTLTEDGLLICVCRDVTDRKQAELRLKQQAEQERLLGSITQRMRSSLKLDEILKTTVEKVHQVLQTDRVLVYQIFPNGTGAAIAESVHPGCSKVLDLVFPEEVFPQENYDRYVDGRICVLSDCEDERQHVLPCLVEFLKEIQVRAKLVVPISQKQSLWGLLIAHQCDRPRQWKTWEINLLQQVANQLAIAIQQANLFDRLQQELTERQLAQQQLTERNQQLAISNEELARATRLKDEFLANMSHELRTPLNAILGMAEGLQESVFGEVNAQQLKALKTIERSGSHLLELINDILDVAKIEAGQIELDCIPVALEPLCTSSLVFIKQQALKKRIQLKLELSAHLPDLSIDERRIRQVLINLLNNAVKFTSEEGHITLKASLLKRSDDAETPLAPHQDYLRISVIDTGIGIAPENVKKLFQPFVQVDSALNRQYPGTGLGLALVKRIVELHGGHVGLISEVGVGSCFMIDLPCTYTAPLPFELTQPPKHTLEYAQFEQPSSSAILLAEDNEANIATLSGYLETKGYCIVVARDGQEAIALAQSEQPALILMDIQMPGMDGLEAMQHIRKIPSLADVPIIALTALAMKGDRERCLAAGATDYLSKPVKLKQLASLIQEHLASKYPSS